MEEACKWGVMIWVCILPYMWNKNIFTRDFQFSMWVCPSVSYLCLSSVTSKRKPIMEPTLSLKNKTCPQAYCKDIKRIYRPTILYVEMERVNTDFHVLCWSCTQFIGSKMSIIMKNRDKNSHKAKNWQRSGKSIFLQDFMFEKGIHIFHYKWSRTSQIYKM